MDENIIHCYCHKSIRLKNYDYSQPGSYFVTICTQNRELLFGNIADGEIVLDDVGRIVEKCLLEIPEHYPNVKLDKFVIMPNHVHLIIVIHPFLNDNHVGAQNLCSYKTNFNM